MDRDNNTHKLPVGWIWTALEAVSLPISRMNRSYQNQEDEFSYIDIEAIDNQKYKLKIPQIYKWGNAPSRAQQKLNVNDILIAAVRPYLKNIALIPPHDVNYIASTGFCVIRPILIEPKYVYYFVLSQSFIDSINKKAKGTSYPAVSNKTILSQSLALPPLKEQLRIVEKIEELFSELDHSEAGLEKAQKQLIVYKQVLLKTAFDGELTKSWRQIYKDENYKWLKSKIEDIGVVKGGKRLPKGGRYSNIKTKFPYLRVSDFNKYSVNQYDLKYIDIETRKRIENYTISKDDVYISIAGTIGLTGIVPENLDNSNLTENAAKIVVNSNVNNKFLAYALNAPELQSQIIEKTKATSQPKLSLYSIRSLQTFIPALDEQYRIVQILESRFTLIENLDISINAGIKKIEVFRQTILKKAFEGKLVRQYSSDESANILLTKIKKEKDTYLNLQKEVNKVKQKKDRTMDGNMTILEILKQNDKPILAKELWQASKHKYDIESFYAELKEIYSQIIEVKIDTESLLSLKK